MTETIYTDAMIEACACAARDAWSAAAGVAQARPWIAIDEEEREHWRESARVALTGAGVVSELTRAVVVAVAKAMGWPRK